MSMAPQLAMRQGQSLVMTPQLLQSIRLLQLSQLELDQFIAAEIEKNPLLKRDDADVLPDADHWGVSIEPDTGPQNTGPQDYSHQDTGPHAAAISLELDVSAAALSEKLDASLDNVFPDAAMAEPARLQRGEVSSNITDLEDTRAESISLKAHLSAQIALLRLSQEDRAIAATLTDALDDNGYLTVTLSEMAEAFSVSESAVRRLLNRLQTLEPAGVYAQSLSDCLALQLKAKDRFDPAMEALIENLPLLAKRDFAALQPLCGVNSEDLLDMLAEIRRLDPKPGAAFISSGAEPVVPDVIVGEASDGGWSVQLNPDALPRVLVDKVYYASIAPHARTNEDKVFLSECLKNANWLERSLDQRAKTILKVASEIVRQQDGFFAHGVSQLRPLSLRALADLVEMHESTISRVTVNKFMATPRGTFELRYFFTAAIQNSEEGEAHSAESVRHRIRAMIENELAKKVLSDDAIVDALMAEKIDIARRTVAKYRESMGIASSVERRREKKALASRAFS
jgi:RNA polymerase sigma-54 factor